MYPSAVFFSTSEEAVSSCKRISIDTLGKTALKCGNLPSLTVIRPKRAKILPHKVAKVFRRLFRGGRGHEHAPHRENVCKISRLCGEMCSLVFNKSVSNLATLLILTRSFQPCWRIFATKVKKHRGRICWFLQGKSWKHYCAIAHI